MFDAIVIGVGGVGSAVCHELAQYGLNVLGLEQFSPKHDLGSTHGETRAIRRAYFEDPQYVPLMHRSYELWRALEERTMQKVLFETGCLIMGKEDSPIMKGCLNSATQHQLPHEVLSSREIKNRYDINIHDQEVGFFEPEGGYLNLDLCLDLFLSEAKNFGATLNFNEKVQSFIENTSGVEVITDKNSYHAKKLIVCSGAWANEMLDFKFSIRKAILYWFKQSRVKDNLPVFFHETLNRRWIYGFPPKDKKIKLSYHDTLEPCDPNAPRTEATPEDVQQMTEDAAQHIDLGEFEKSKTCMYTMTPDEHFALGVPPGCKDVFVISGLSGHGYKFAPVLAEVAKDFAISAKTPNIEFLNLNRFN